MELAVKIGQLLLSLSILIILHEMGHFFPARWFNTRVEKFYLFFDPYFHLFEKKVGETRYGIGWLPLGGYVKIAGMVDESMDTEALKLPPQPWEFRSKPAWQRLIIMLGGVTVNFLLGIAIIAGMLMYYGEESLSLNNAKYGISIDTLGKQIGLQDGDKILKIGNKTAADLRADDGGKSIQREILMLGSNKTIEVERNGVATTINLPPDVSNFLILPENQKKPLFTLLMPFVVGSIPGDSHNAASGLKVGDKLLSLDGKPILFQQQFETLAQELKEKTVALRVLREGKDTISLNVLINKDAKIGFGVDLNLEKYFSIDKKTYGVGEALVGGVQRAFGFIGTQITAFGKMFRGEIKTKNAIGGFDVIAEQFGGVWIWERFWHMTASLSLVLAFMNLLPIPGLDGGHVVFTLYEMLTGRKPNEKFMEYATLVGIALILGLMLYANIFRRWF
ncbi:MAG: hypothetical protein RL757_1393 [Bacteroidota bacterium]|jgi:regulator of sigma E protease